MSRPLSNDFNAVTGEYTSREMNDAEFEQYEKDLALAQLLKNELIQAEAEAAANKEKAKAKLEALGLDENDLKALGL